MSLLPQQDQDAPAARCRWRCCSCILAVASVLLSWSFTHVLCSVFLVAFTVLPHIRCIFGLSTGMLLHIDDVETVTNEAIHAVITLPCRTRVHLAWCVCPLEAELCSDTQCDRLNRLNAFLTLMTAYFFLRVRVHDDDRPISVLSP